MRRALSSLILALLLLAGLPVTAQAITFRAGDVVEIPADTVIADDLYVAAREVRILGRIEGDLVAAAETLTVSGEVRDDLIAMGRLLNLEGPVGQSIRAAAETVTVSGAVGRDVLLAGSQVTQAATAQVAGASVLTGRAIAVRGTTAGTLQASGANVLIDGRVAAAEVNAEDLTVTAGAQIEGPLTYSSRHEADIRPGASVVGPVTREEVKKTSWQFPTWLGRAFLFMAGSLTGILLALIMPKGLAAIAQAQRQLPWESAAAGAGIVFGTPLLAILLLITVIGIPLGLMLFFLYGLGVYLAWVIAAICLGILLLSWAPLANLRLRMVLATLLGVFVLLMLQSLPWVGGLVIVLALIAGFGGTTMAIVQAVRA